MFAQRAPVDRDTSLFPDEKIIPATRQPNTGVVRLLYFAHQCACHAIRGHHRLVLLQAYDPTQVVLHLGGGCAAATSGYKNKDDTFMHGPLKYEVIVKQISGGDDSRHQTSLLTAANNNNVYELNAAIRRLGSVDEATSGLAIGADVSSSSTQAPPYISLPMIAKSTNASPPADNNASHIV